MNAGMGDTVFAPMYQVLRQRGVNFQFFNRVVNLGLDEGRTALANVTLSRQINLNGSEYEPLILVKDLPLLAQRTALRPNR